MFTSSVECTTFDLLLAIWFWVEMVDSVICWMFGSTCLWEHMSTKRGPHHRSLHTSNHSKQWHPLQIFHVFHTFERNKFSLSENFATLQFVHLSVCWVFEHLYSIRISKDSFIMFIMVSFMLSVCWLRTSKNQWTCKTRLQRNSANAIRIYNKSLSHSRGR